MISPAQRMAMIRHDDAKAVNNWLIAYLSGHNALDRLAPLTVGEWLRLSDRIDQSTYTAHDAHGYRHGLGPCVCEACEAIHARGTR